MKLEGEWTELGQKLACTDSLKTFVLISTISIMILISKKRTYFAQKVLSKSQLIWNFHVTDLLYIFIEDPRNALMVKKMSKYWNWKGTGLSWNQKLACSVNSGQNIWNNIVKSNETGHEKKSLISTFSCFLTAIAKV